MKHFYVIEVLEKKDYIMRIAEYDNAKLLNLTKEIRMLDYTDMLAEEAKSDFIRFKMKIKEDMKGGYYEW